jgi:hypothetical protein
VVWDREGEEWMELGVVERKGMGREEGKGRR